MSHNKIYLRNITFNETFDSEVQKSPKNKFVLDRSLVKGIKQNDVTKIIGPGQKLGDVDNAEQYDQVHEMAAIVISARRGYDAKRVQAFRLEEAIARLKKQKQLLVMEENKFKEEINKQNQQLNEVDSKLAEMSEMLEEALLKKDVYDNLKNTIKKDLLVLKKRYFDKDVYLLRESTRLKTLKTQHEYKVKLSTRCKQLTKTLQHSVETNKNQRYDKISSFYDVLEKKRRNQSYHESRLRSIEESMQAAIYDKFPQEQQWLKLLHSHLLLKQILKSKMQRLMHKYKPIEFAFHKMKQASSSIGNSSELIEKYLDREQRYGVLLQSIAMKEGHLDGLKQEREKLAHENARLQLINDEIKTAVVDRRQTDYQEKGQLLHSLEQKIIKNCRQMQGMYQWGVKFWTVYQGLSSRDQIVKKYPKQHTKKLMLTILNEINQFLSSQQRQSKFNSKVQSVFLTLSPQKTILDSNSSHKNTRIKSMSTLDPDSRADALEEHDLLYDDLSEADFLQHNRRAIKKNDMQMRKFRIKTRHL